VTGTAAAVALGLSQLTSTLDSLGDKAIAETLGDKSMAEISGDKAMANISEDA
jgi:hypothetical protein